MTLQIWNPRTLSRMSPYVESDSMYEPSSWNWPSRGMWWKRPHEEMAWEPSLDVYEKENDYIVKAELPGIMMDNIDISMSRGVLSIKGERKTSDEIKDEDYQRCELSYGSFSRSLSFAEPIKEDKIEATMENGMLEIRLPKMSEVPSSKIKVKSKS